MLTAFNGVPISTLAVRERPHTHTIHSRYQISQDKWQADKLTKQHRRRDKEIQVSESKQRRFLTSSGLEKLCCCCSRVFSARQSSRTRLTNLDDDEFNPSIDWCSSSCPRMSWSSLCNDHHPRFQFLTEWTAEGWTISERNSRGKISERFRERHPIAYWIPRYQKSDQCCVWNYAKLSNISSKFGQNNIVQELTSVAGSDEPSSSSYWRRKEQSSSCSSNRSALCTEIYICKAEFNSKLFL